MTELIEKLPAEIVGYVALSLMILYIARKMYGELLTKTEERLDRVEASLAEQAQSSHDDRVALAAAQVELATIHAQLEAARQSEGRCEARMGRLEERHEASIVDMEARYATRIGELENEIQILRVRLGEVSETYIDGGSRYE